MTFEERIALRRRVGAVMRARYRRERRMNLTGEVRPFEKRPLGPLRETAR